MKNPTTPSLPPEGFVDVIWSVRIPAKTPDEGASLARLMQFDPSSLASIYHVRDSEGTCAQVDLQESSALVH
jgi:hypothetical protein